MAEELTDAQQTELIEQLHRLRTELEQIRASEHDESKPVSLDQPIGRLSRMDAIQQQQMAAASRRQLELRLQQVIAALGAAEAGTYGYCRGCEEPIGFRRLRARPESPLCLECQGQRERA